jgi:hypothetical protein
MRNGLAWHVVLPCCLLAGLASASGKAEAKPADTSMITFVVQSQDVQCIMPYTMQHYVQEPASGAQAKAPASGTQAKAPAPKSAKPDALKAAPLPAAPDLVAKKTYAVVMNLTDASGQNLETLTSANIGRTLGIYFKPSGKAPSKLMRIAYAVIQAPLQSSFTVTGLSPKEYALLRHHEGFPLCKPDT